MGGSAVRRRVQQVRGERCVRSPHGYGIHAHNPGAGRRTGTDGVVRAISRTRAIGRAAAASLRTRRVKRIVRGCVVIAMWSAASAFAETMYVTDQFTVGLRADVTPAATVLATVSTGAALEILERNSSFVRVRDANGIEGWVEATALAPQPPAAQQLKSVRAELDRTRAQLANTQGELGKARAAPAADGGQVQAELASTRVQLGKFQSDIKKKDDEIAAATAARDTAVKETPALPPPVAHQ